MTQKIEYSSGDAQPIVLYAKDDVNSSLAYPVIAGMFNPGFAIGQYDYVVFTPPTSTPTTIQFYIGGHLGHWLIH